MSQNTNLSMSLSDMGGESLNPGQKLGLTFVALSALILLTGIVDQTGREALFLWSFLGTLTIGSLMYTYAQYKNTEPGIMNNGIYLKSLTSRGAWAWILGIFLTGLYVILYWFPAYLGQGVGEVSNTGLVGLFDPLSQILKGQDASQWFVYGTLYTMAILLMGFKYIYKYRHNTYQIIRTISVMFFQLSFAFLLPEFMLSMNLPYNDFKNMWPLNYYFFDNWNLNAMLSSGALGFFMLIWGIAMIFIISPILTYFYGKRWYCSWVCGCGGLAETAGDPFRHLSDKSVKAWRVERWLIHTVLVLAVIMTIGVLYSFFYDNPGQHWLSKQNFAGLVLVLTVLGAGILWYKRNSWFTESNRIGLYIALGAAALIFILMVIAVVSGGRNVFLLDPYSLRSFYGFYIGAAFSGVIGVGFYPIMGSRVWCRFGCPMAAILGLQQKWFSRFRITTNGGQCISCGNCSTYCEMGIDVKSYAQRGENIVRASCVGCGVCSAVCPRGVLKLENGPATKKVKNEDPITFEDGVIRLKL